MSLWCPTTILSHVDVRRSSTNVSVVETDHGLGYLKAMGNPVGPHALACDLVGSRLAQMFGLSVFDMSIIMLDDMVDIPFADKSIAQVGPALITRAVDGAPWSNARKQLKQLDNPDDITRLVIFDNWILNRDRHFPPVRNLDNVFLSQEAKKGKFHLLAIDHTHCFGSEGGEITRKVSHIANVNDEKTYGLFPEFKPFLNRVVAENSVQWLKTIDRQQVADIIESIPKEWEVDTQLRTALAELIVRRASFISTTILEVLWPQKRLNFAPEAEVE